MRANMNLCVFESVCSPWYLCWLDLSLTLKFHSTKSSNLTVVMSLLSESDWWLIYHNLQMVRNICDHVGSELSTPNLTQVGNISNHLRILAFRVFFVLMSCFRCNIGVHCNLSNRSFDWGKETSKCGHFCCFGWVFFRQEILLTST